MAASWLWYEECEEGLGDRLYEAVKQKLNTISKNPDIFSIKRNPYHEAKIAIFPFVIVYKISKRKKIIEVISDFILPATLKKNTDYLNLRLRKN